MVRHADDDKCFNPPDLGSNEKINQRFHQVFENIVVSQNVDEQHSYGELTNEVLQNLILALDTANPRNDMLLKSDAPWISSARDNTTSIAWGDVNGDGYPELAVGKDDDLIHLHLRNDNTNELESYYRWSSNETHMSGSVAWGDIDDDGDLDLAAGTSDEGTLVYLNDNGQLKSQPFWIEGYDTKSLAWGDMDGDGIPELAGGSFEQLPYVLSFSTIMETLVPERTRSPSSDGKRAISVYWMDVDGDHTLDLVVGLDDGTKEGFLNKTGRLQGGLVLSSENMTADDIPQSVAWFDMDHDHDQDLAVVNDAGVMIFYRNRQIQTSDADGCIEVISADSFDEGTAEPSCSMILERLVSEQAWSAHPISDQTPPDERVTSVAWGDVDRDGDLDLAVGRYEHGNQVYLNQDGMLQNEPAWTSVTADSDYNPDDETTRSVAWGDMNDDGYPELAVANSEGATIVYRNHTGRLLGEDPWRSTDHRNSTSLTWGDVDNDGDLDLAVGSSGSGTRIYRNDQGSLSTNATWHSKDADNTTSIAWGDMDGDGDLDLATGVSGDANKIYLNPLMESVRSEPGFDPALMEKLFESYVRELDTTRDEAQQILRLSAKGAEGVKENYLADHNLDESDLMVIGAPNGKIFTFSDVVNLRDVMLKRVVGTQIEEEFFAEIRFKLMKELRGEFNSRLTQWQREVTEQVFMAIVEPGDDEQVLRQKQTTAKACVDASGECPDLPLRLARMVSVRPVSLLVEVVNSRRFSAYVREHPEHEEIADLLSAAATMLFEEKQQEPEFQSQMETIVEARANERWRSVMTKAEAGFHTQLRTNLILIALHKIRNGENRPFDFEALDGDDQPIGTQENINRLADYLLLDLAVDESQLTTPVAFAIGRIHTLVQSAQLGTLSGYTPIGIAEDKWSWLKSYGSWHALQMLSHYPESFLFPEMRKSISPDFDLLIDRLDDGVDTAVSEYLARISDYKSVEVFKTIVIDDNIFIFARSHSGKTIYSVIQDNGSWIGWRLLPLDLEQFPGSEDPRFSSAPRSRLEVIAYDNYLYFFRLFADDDENEIRMYFVSAKVDGTLLGGDEEISDSQQGTTSWLETDYVILDGFKNLNKGSNQFIDFAVTKDEDVDPSKWLAMASLDQEYLFSLDSQFAAILDKGKLNVGDELHLAFSDQHELLDSSAILTVEETGLKWKIVTSRKEYRIENADIELEVYDRPDEQEIWWQDFWIENGKVRGSPSPHIYDLPLPMQIGDMQSIQNGTHVMWLGTGSGESTSELHWGRPKNLNPGNTLISDHAKFGQRLDNESFGGYRDPPSRLEYYFYIDRDNNDPENNAVIKDGPDISIAQTEEVRGLAWIGQSLYTIHADSYMNLATRDMISIGLDAETIAEDLLSEKKHDGGAFTYLEEYYLYLPVLIADHLNENRRFEEAFAWLRKIYDPFLPLEEQSEVYSYIQSIGTCTQPEIQALLQDTFDPNTVAIQCGDIFLNAIKVLQVKNLLDWADQLFVLDTNESVNRARELYELAADILDTFATEDMADTARLRRIRAQQRHIQSILSVDEWLSVAAMLRAIPDNHLEEALASIVNIVSMPGPFTFKAMAVEAKIYTYSDTAMTASTLTGTDYIQRARSVPANPMAKLLEWRVESNLAKIRTNRNFAGIQRNLQPYATPVDPTRALKSLASGQGLADQLMPSGPPSVYRYAVLLDRAKYLVNVAQQFENSMLAAIKGEDEAAYNYTRARQDLQLERANVTLQSLRQIEALDMKRQALEQLARAQTELDHFANLLEQGPLGYEVSALVFMLTSAYLPTSVGISGISYSPSGAFQTLANVQSTLASYERREQEWEFQRDLAQHDIDLATIGSDLADDHIDIVAQERNIASLRAEFANDAIEYMENEQFANTQLYRWMNRNLQDLYKDQLNMAIATAKAAQQALEFERQTTLDYITYDYWDDEKRGLLGAKRLLQDIDKLEQYRLNTATRKKEIEKTLSLASVTPVEFQRFKEKGILEFATLPQWFERDFPGHYLRLIKDVRVNLVAIVPSIDGIHATLTNNGHSQVMAGPPFEKMSDIYRLPESIAISSPNNATGLFELSPNDPMLFPFEGNGVATSWRLEMDKGANRFNYDTIYDVLFTIRYTALESTDYRQMVLEKMEQDVDGYVKAESVRFFSLANEFVNEWYQFHNPIRVEGTDEYLDPYAETCKSGQCPALADLGNKPLRPYAMVIELQDESFAFNEENLEIKSVTLAIQREENKGENQQPITLQMKFLPSETTAVTDTLSIAEDKFSKSTEKMNGRAPFGYWVIQLPNSEEDVDLSWLKDVLLIIEYEAKVHYN